MFKGKVSIKNILLMLLFFFILLLVLAAALFFRIEYLRIDASNNIISEYPESYSHEFNKEYHFRQNGNDCGPINVAAVLRMKDVEVNNQDIINKTKFRFKNDYTHPWGIEDHFWSKLAYDTSSLNRNEKVDFIKDQLSSGYVGILLGGTDDYQHYITLLGYGADDFYVYDSLHTRGEEGMTIDSNDDLVGNRTLTEEELLSFWSKGGMYGFYENYVLFVPLGK